MRRAGGRMYLAIAIGGRVRGIVRRRKSSGALSPHPHHFQMGYGRGEAWWVGIELASLAPRGSYGRWD